MQSQITVYSKVTIFCHINMSTNMPTRSSEKSLPKTLMTLLRPIYQMRVIPQIVHKPGVTVACADNWKASQANEIRRMWNIYEETGVFAAACRHGMILWLVDMVRSGELSVI